LASVAAVSLIAKSWNTPEVALKPQVRFKGKAQADEKAQHTR
jgi:hypothetical protein